METAQFSIPLLADDRQALDLTNALLAVKGVAAIRSDVQGHRVVVDYDAGFTDTASLKGLIEHAGYPVGDDR